MQILDSSDLISGDSNFHRLPDSRISNLFGGASSVYTGRGITYSRTAKKWQMLPASTKTCQTAWL